ncbi:VOC family protein [Tsukamurella soli]|uniref:VOC family protein n=1 Tax=Tsukamurella soli TaxID=644556 RepID=UPI0036111C02
MLVLYVRDLAESVRFYQTLGLHLVEEQHADGPVHYSATLDGTVLELYPAPPGVPPCRVRIGLRVPDPAEAMERLRAARFTVKRPGLAVDPDGNRIVIGWGGCRHYLHLRGFPSPCLSCGDTPRRVDTLSSAEGIGRDSVLFSRRFRPPSPRAAAARSPPRGSAHGVRAECS